VAIFYSPKFDDQKESSPCPDTFRISSQNFFASGWWLTNTRETAPHVHEYAVSLVEQLNGAMWIARKTHRIRTEGVIEFKPDGAQHMTSILAAGHFEGRSRVHAVGIVVSLDGKILPSPGPEESDVQKWTELADKEEVLADALVYLSRAEWFDIYKAIECLEDRVGGELPLRKLNWIGAEDFKRLKRTANSFRHRKDGTHRPPEKPMEQKEALEQLAVMIGRAFADALERSAKATGS
jgi:hypothetical protein